MRLRRSLTGSCAPPQARGVRDILAIDLSPAMLAELRLRYCRGSTVSGNTPAVRTWLGEVTQLPPYQVGWGSD